MNLSSFPFGDIIYIMFKPKYELSKTLLSNITEVERLYGQIEALQIPKKLEVNLKRDNLTQSAYVSNSIEGNPLSLREVTNLLLDDRVPTNRDEKEVRNYFDLLENLCQKKKEEINVQLILDIHEKLMNGVKDDIAGKIRNNKVVIGKYNGKDRDSMSLEVKHEPPFHKSDDIKKALGELNNWLEKSDAPTIVKAGSFHHQFVFVHPFADGNGRVCRLLTALIFIKEGYAINKYFVLDDYYDIDRIEYSDKLHSADFNDKTEWLEYFSNGVKYSLQSALSRVKEGLSSLKIEERPTKREKEVIEIIKKRREITSTDVADELGVTRQQAHNLLSSLIDKGILDKKGKTKSSYYFLK